MSSAFKAALEEIKHMIDTKTRERDELDKKIEELQATQRALENVIKFQPGETADGAS